MIHHLRLFRLFQEWLLASIADLSKGHTFFFSSHWSIHSAWKLWLHGAKKTLPGPIFYAQMPHWPIAESFILCFELSSYLGSIRMVHYFNLKSTKRADAMKNAFIIVGSGDSIL
jgi:hypothetical protein